LQDGKKEDTKLKIFNQERKTGELEKCGTLKLREWGNGIGQWGVRVTGLFLSKANVVGLAIDLLVLVLREASREWKLKR